MQSSTSESTKLVEQDLQNWWAKTGIPTKTNHAMEKLILHDIDEYKLRKKNRNGKTKTEETKRDQFLCKMKQTFWAIQPSYESQLRKWQQQDIQDKRHKEDYLYLEKVRGENRTATIGSKDMKLVAKRKRSMRDKEALEAKRFASTESSMFAVAIITSSESGSECVVEEPNFVFTNNVEALSTSAKFTRNEGIPNNAYLVADKYGLSNRALTELAAAFHTSEGKALNQLYLSVITTRRKAQIRKSTAAGIVQSQLRDNDHKRFALHWDSKLIKTLTHVGNDLERVAVLLTGNVPAILTSLIVD